jgi:hypothetical protein
MPWTLTWHFSQQQGEARKNHSIRTRRNDPSDLMLQQVQTERPRKPRCEDNERSVLGRAQPSLDEPKLVDQQQAEDQLVCVHCHYIAGCEAPQ